MRLPATLVAVAFTAAASTASAQTWGQPAYGQGPVTTYGQSYSSAPAYAPPITEWNSRAYGATGRAATGYAPGYSAYGYGSAWDGRFGDPYAYRPPVRYTRYGGGYGHHGYGQSRSGEWTRWSSPPGRGYHDVYGYNDDRAPRGHDCYCGTGAYLYDR